MVALQSDKGLYEVMGIDFPGLQFRDLADFRAP